MSQPQSVSARAFLQASDEYVDVRRNCLNLLAHIANFLAFEARPPRKKPTNEQMGVTECILSEAHG